ncbi:peptidase domain-containing ABC transporter [Vibrio cholerae]|uniref:peptidase domain-containing ABC transporter n=1 Tax=Vibrio cholerae TaxID=666 RepID=UPI00115C3B2E|nr:peptidase domain-containing ABC transporter [Vibrio cholerae]EGR1860296.1 peptidase domain-containing ABC transporter [Vibrio cholerae]EGR5448481.1 peptidase domain-containing ABC transporter [Vibrio cholerae]EGR5456488.1 peptidase domain-containing ABC transporter [Vibrio cholerae]MEB5622289.1 ATP-binding cassette domain-containing protein [Vibrio cholerae]TQP75832.1 peptidase domain-containing ABC transporter [Vibrio cholerae]
MQYFNSIDFTSINPNELLSFSGLKRVPVILQSEVSECGLACLAMISSYYGYQINTSSLRPYINIGTQGMSLSKLMDISGQLNLTGRGIKCEIDDMLSLALPCILHWDLNHFVVLTKISNNHFYINDPALGRRKISRERFSESFTGIVLELHPTSEFRKNDSRKTININQLWEKIIGLKRSLCTLLLLSLILQTLTLISPYYIQWVVDDVLLSNDKPLLIVLACGFILLKLLQIFINTFRAWLVIRFSSALNIQMGANIFQHLIRLPLSFFEKRHIGDIVSRFGSINAIRELFTTGLVETVIDGIMAVVVLVMMYLYSPSLAIIVLGFIFMSFLIQILFYYPNRRITEESIVASAKEDSSFFESIRSIQTIKLFSHESARKNHWLNRYADVINTDIRLSKLRITEEAFSNLLSGLESILVVYFGALLVMENNLTVGMLLAFITYKGQFTSSITTFIDNIISFKLLGLHLERLSDIALTDSEAFDSHVTFTNPIQGHLKIENLSFRYDDNSHFILKSLSFEIVPGETVAIIGASGCGKTTLMKLILGLLKPTHGNILLDGVDITRLNVSEYRSYIGSVMQNDSLLSGTIAENITMFDPNFNEEKMRECCKISCISNDIEKLPMGYHSLVGDMGNVFSGGQLQRLFLARALYKSPNLLCLDESSSHLDETNEKLVNENLTKLGITKIIIAHRKQTIDQADRIIDLCTIQSSPSLNITNY